MIFNSLEQNKFIIIIFLTATEKNKPIAVKEPKF